MPRALLSVSDKTGLVDLARGLAARGYELVSTGGTARALAEAGVKATGVSDLTRFPEMLDGRVKTLHPAIHGGILARRDRPEHLAALTRHGIGVIDVVVVNLYPFARAAADPATPFDALVEEIDIGGPSLVRAAAKNFRDVLVVVDPADYDRVLAALDRMPTLEFRHELMLKAFFHTAEYDATIGRTLLEVAVDGDRIERSEQGAYFGVELPDRLKMPLQKVQDLRYGENPHQVAALYRADVARGGALEAGGFGAATVLQGLELSYINLLDLDAAARIVLEFEEPAAAVIKHANPCGVAIGESCVGAYVSARDADRMSSFGGIVAVNRPIDVATAEAIASTKIDAVVAPAVDAAARGVLARRSTMRVVTASFEKGMRYRTEFRSILGAVLAQSPDVVAEAAHSWRPDRLPDGVRVVTRRHPSAEEWEALRFGWRVCAHVKSNAVIFTDARRTLAIGAGQMSRVDAVNVAVMKARAAHVSLVGSVAASDAFFPFRDGLDAVVAAGARAVVQPGGSVKDAEVIAAADEHGLAMVFTGRRHFRH